MKSRVKNPDRTAICTSTPAARNADAMEITRVTGCGTGPSCGTGPTCTTVALCRSTGLGIGHMPLGHSSLPVSSPGSSTNGRPQVLTDPEFRFAGPKLCPASVSISVPAARAIASRRSRSTSSEPQGPPVSTAISILVLVTAAALAAVAVGMAGWLSGLPSAATGLGACGALALTFGVGLYITYWRGQSRNGK